ncbi:MAG: hypothetical protein DRO18_00010 [Thermoprotei archaeon]|nr:MAG: hypothetical protein DRO18_00010 [Thermoprotei archaeon]
MASSVTVRLPRGVAKRLEREAKRVGLSLEEYILELALRDLDPSERVWGHIEASKDFLEQAKEELKEGNVRQAAEKVWGAAALSIKAYAEWKEGRRLASHKELWEYMRKLVRELGPWVREVWMYANSMHICFYEEWCDGEDVEEALKRVRKLVSEIGRRIKA